MKYFLAFLLLMFSADLTMAEEVSEPQINENSYQNMTQQRYLARQKRLAEKRAEAENKKQLENENAENYGLNDAQIFERQMLEKKRQNYKPRAKNKRISGKSARRNASASGNSRKTNTKRSRSGSNAESRLPSVGSGMFVR